MSFMHDLAIRRVLERAGHASAAVDDNDSPELHARLQAITGLMHQINELQTQVVEDRIADAVTGAPTLPQPVEAAKIADSVTWLLQDAHMLESTTLQVDAVLNEAVELEEERLEGEQFRDRERQGMDVASSQRTKPVYDKLVADLSRGIPAELRNRDWAALHAHYTTLAEGALESRRGAQPAQLHQPPAAMK